MSRLSAKLGEGMMRHDTSVDRCSAKPEVADAKAMAKDVPPKVSGLTFTIPNVICLCRIVGSFGLVPLAIADRPLAVLTLFLALMFSDWIDGKLAILLDQRSELGPRLDSLADLTMYAGLLFALIWLRAAVIAGEIEFLAAAGITYAASCGFAAWKFSQLPSYHTRSAKTSWFLMAVAAVSLFLDWSVWPFRVALVAVSLANLESIFITALLHEPRTDVISWFAARRNVN